MSPMGIRIGCVLAAVMSTSVANAQYFTGFEDLSADADGNNLTGQDGYYLPNDTSTDFEVYTYSANSLRLPQNPTGGTRFIAGVGEGNGTFERAQRDMSYGNGRGLWEAAFDIAASYVGFGPSAQNIGSFSTQTFPGAATFIALSTWVDPATPTSWNANYIWFDSADNQLQEVVPDAGFQNLAVDHWYRWSTSFDLTTNQIVEVSLTDLMTGDVSTYNPVGRYLDGGAGGGAAPTGFRFFAGGSVPGNVLAFDNPSIIPAPGAALLLGLGGLAAARRRR